MHTEDILFPILLLVGIFLFFVSIYETILKEEECDKLGGVLIENTCVDKSSVKVLKK